MLGPPKARDLDRPALIAVESYVPKDHFYRHLHRVLDLSFIHDLVADRYAAGGRPSLDPEVFFRLQLLMFFSGIRSERQLLEQADYNLAMRWYAGYNRDEPLPDHSSLSKIRTRLGLPIFRRFFEAVTEQCVTAGLVRGDELIFDATKVRANASMDSLIPRLRLLTEEHLAQLEPPEKPGTLWEMNDARWDLLEECRLDPARPSSDGYERKSDRQVSTTDPDAVAMGRMRTSWSGGWAIARSATSSATPTRPRRPPPPTSRRSEQGRIAARAGIVAIRPRRLPRIPTGIGARRSRAGTLGHETRETRRWHAA